LAEKYYKMGAEKGHSGSKNNLDLLYKNQNKLDEKWKGGFRGRGGKGRKGRKDRKWRL
jgi:TPR repeat protein